jgi:hypothetical protein
MSPRRQKSWCVCVCMCVCMCVCVCSWCVCVCVCVYSLCVYSTHTHTHTHTHTQLEERATQKAQCCQASRLLYETSEKETYIGGKETYIGGKETYIGGKEGRADVRGSMYGSVGMVGAKLRKAFPPFGTFHGFIKAVREVHVLN